MTVHQNFVAGQWTNSADENLHRRIRAQGNFIEYVPLGVITLAWSRLTPRQLGSSLLSARSW